MEIKKGTIMLKSFNQLPDAYQGVIYIITGTIVLLYALGIIQKGISILVIGFSLYMILVGCTKLGITQKASDLLGHTKRQ
jgi:hypothetical protein